MASKVNVTVVTSKGRKDFTDKFNSKGLLVLQAESPVTDAWLNASETFGTGLVELFNDASLKDAVIEVNAEPTEYLAGKLYKWTFGTIAQYIATATMIQEVLIASNIVAPKDEPNKAVVSPDVTVTAEKLAKGDKTPRAAKVGVSAESLKAELI